MIMSELEKDKALVGTERQDSHVPSDYSYSYVYEDDKTTHGRGLFGCLGKKKSRSKQAKGDKNDRKKSDEAKNKPNDAGETNSNDVTERKSVLHDEGLNSPRDGNGGNSPTGPRHDNLGESGEGGIGPSNTNTSPRRDNSPETEEERNSPKSVRGGNSPTGRRNDNLPDNKVVRISPRDGKGGNSPTGRQNDNLPDNKVVRLSPRDGKGGNSPVGRRYDNLSDTPERRNSPIRDKGGNSPTRHRYETYPDDDKPRTPQNGHNDNNRSNENKRYQRGHINEKNAILSENDSYSPKDQPKSHPPRKSSSSSDGGGVVKKTKKRRNLLRKRKGFSSSPASRDPDIVEIKDRETLIRERAALDHASIRAYSDASSFLSLLLGVAKQYHRIIHMWAILRPQQTSAMLRNAYQEYAPYRDEAKRRRELERGWEKGISLNQKSITVIDVTQIAEILKDKSDSEIAAENKVIRNQVHILERAAGDYKERLESLFSCVEHSFTFNMLARYPSLRQAILLYCGDLNIQGEVSDMIPPIRPIWKGKLADDT